MTLNENSTPLSDRLTPAIVSVQGARRGLRDARKMLRDSETVPPEDYYAALDHIWAIMSHLGLIDRTLRRLFHDSGEVQINEEKELPLQRAGELTKADLACDTYRARAGS